MSNEDTMKEVRADIQENMQYAKRPYATGLVANYLLLQILDKLEELGDDLKAIDLGISTIYNEIHDERHNK